MCIIVYKPKGVKMPKESTMKNCFESNPHGAGYMFRRDNVVHVRKGFMTFDAFTSDVDSQNFTKKDDIVFHFRIATHSKVSPENTHPFPITSVRSELHEILIDCKRALVHNGILHDFVDTTDDISDSAFFAKMLFPCQRESQYKAILNCHNKSSKFVVMTSKFTIVSGNFVKKYGCHFSNYGFEDPVVTACTTYHSSVGNGVITLPSGHTFDTSAGCTGFGGRVNIIDEDDEKWEKLYGDNGEVTRQYQRDKMYSSRRGSSGQQLIGRREYDADTAWARSIRHSGNSFRIDEKPKKIQVKTTDGKIISLDSFADKKCIVPALPNTMTVNGKQISFSEGVSDETKLGIIQKYCRESEDREKFEEYLRYGDDTIVGKQPMLALESSDGMWEIVVTDTMTKAQFYSHIHDGYKLTLDRKHLGEKNMVTVLGNAAGIIDGEGRTTVVSDGYTAKFYRGGIDDKIIMSVHKHVTEKLGISSDDKKEVDEKITEDLQALKSMMDESIDYGQDDMSLNGTSDDSGCDC
jgi:hypothetical protein